MSFFTELPTPILASALLEDPSGGVILVGGSSLFDSFRTSIYKLEHAGADQKWIELESKLKIGRNYHTASFIPDELTNCTLAL
jgi:hypothetical protein